MLIWTIQQDGPVAIRYAKDGRLIEQKKNKGISFSFGRWECFSEGKDAALFATGSMVRNALEAGNILRNEGLQVSVYNCSTVKPLDEEALRKEAGRKPIITIEEHMVTGGFGEFVTQRCREMKIKTPVDCIGIPDTFIQHGKHSRLLKDVGLDPEQMADRIRNTIRRITD